MSPSRIFILRPVATSLMMAGIVLIGVVAYTQLPVSALPQVDYPTIQIQTFYPGASPEVMTSAVTAPLEKQFGQVPGLNQMTSISSYGSSLITLQFTLDLGIDVAEQEVQAAINAAGTYLPTLLPNPPIYSKVNPADAPVLTLAITSKTVPLINIEEYAEVRMAQRISQLKGVGYVSISGGERRAVRVQANPTALASYGLSMDTLRTALSSANVNQAKGNFDGKDQAWTINDNDQLSSGAQYKPIIIAYRNGAPVRLSDVATIIDAPENNKQAAWVGNDQAIILNIQRQPGTNIISVVNSIQALLPQIRASLPPGVDVRVITDRTTTIRASVKDVEFELMLTIGLVVMVIFLFLRSLSATIIPGIAVPLSLVGTFGVMYLLGYSLDNLSLMALTISTGFVVDDAIVMIENISRYIEMGDSAMQAALKGSAEIGFTIVSLTVSLIAVLIPLLFMADVVGRLFREFAVTLAVTIVFSAFVSLTLTPMMAARILKHKPEHERGGLYRFSEWCFVKSIEQYGKMVQVVLRHQVATLMVAAGNPGAHHLLVRRGPQGLFPGAGYGRDSGHFASAGDDFVPGHGAAPAGTGQGDSQDPAVENLTSFIGVDGAEYHHEQRPHPDHAKAARGAPGVSASDVIRRLEPKVDTGARHRALHAAGAGPDGGRPHQPDAVSISLDAPDKAILDQWVPRLVDRLKQIPELRDVASDQQNEGLGLRVEIDRDTAGRLGITPQNIDDALYDAFGQRQVSTIYTQSNQYPRDSGSAAAVAAECVRAERHLCADRLGFAEPRLDHRAGRNQYRAHRRSAFAQAPLGVFYARHAGPAPITINHQGQFPVVTLSFNLAPGASLGAAVANSQGDEETWACRPASSPHSRAPRAPSRISLANESLLILAAIVTVYIVLGVLYESYIHPRHDSVHPAFGRRGRHRGANAVPRGSGCHCAHRHHPAHRYRQEKRHYDDRLRARSRAQGRQDAGGGDLPGLFAALPAHHDDHHGGAAGRGAAGLRHRRRFRAAAAAGHHHHRRTAGQPGAHAVHHPGHLSVVWTNGELGGAKARQGHRGPRSFAG